MYTLIAERGKCLHPRPYQVVGSLTRTGPTSLRRTQDIDSAVSRHEKRWAPAEETANINEGGSVTFEGSGDPSRGNVPRRVPQKEWAEGAGTRVALGSPSP